MTARLPDWLCYLTALDTNGLRAANWNQRRNAGARAGPRGGPGTGPGQGRARQKCVRESSRNFGMPSRAEQQDDDADHSHIYNHGDGSSESLDPLGCCGCFPRLPSRLCSSSIRIGPSREKLVLSTSSSSPLSCPAALLSAIRPAWNFCNESDGKLGKSSRSGPQIGQHRRSRGQNTPKHRSSVDHLPEDQLLELRGPLFYVGFFLFFSNKATWV
ncbi:unnamed protein product [Calypogeia fissa]